MTPIEMFMQDEAPAPEPHPCQGHHCLGPRHRCCQGKKHLSVAFWAVLLLPGPGSHCARGDPATGAGSGSNRATALPPAAFWYSPAACGRHLAASHKWRAFHTPCPARPGPHARVRHPLALPGRLGWPGDATARGSGVQALSAKALASEREATACLFEQCPPLFRLNILSEK